MQLENVDGTAGLHYQILHALFRRRYSLSPGFTSKAWYHASMLRTDAVDAELGPACGSVSTSCAASSSRILRAPHLRPAEEEALITGEAVDHRRLLAIQRER